MKREIQEILAAIFCVAYFMTSWIDITVEGGPYIIKVTKKKENQNFLFISIKQRHGRVHIPQGCTNYFYIRFLSGFSERAI